MIRSSAASKYVLVTIAVLFLVSGLVRIGSSGLALAKGSEAEPAAPTAVSEREDEALLREVLVDVRKQTEALEQRAAALADREAALDLAKQVIEKRMTELADAEQRLAATVDMVDGASERDLDKLTQIYAAMKPKTAAQLFEQMDAEFAAGFLGRMQSDAAGGILTGLSPEKAYAISVFLAGRNALAPQN